jgi:multiple sugar transport system permease protein
VHVGRIGRRGIKVRAGFGLLYLFLTLGGVTTLYPFVLMLSTATKSQSDYNDYSPAALVPRYWRDEGPLYTKYLEDRYANNLDDLNAAHDADYPKVTDARLPAPGSTQSWEMFVQALPPTYKKAGFGEHENAPSRLMLLWRERLRAQFGTIEKLNEAWTEENKSFEAVAPPPEKLNLRAWTPDLTRPKVCDWEAFKATLPPVFLIADRSDTAWRRFLKEDRYENNLEQINSVWNQKIPRWEDITLPRKAPIGPSRTDWEVFVRTKLPLRVISLSVPLPEKISKADFVAGPCPLDAISADTTENLWREKYSGALVPQASVDLAYVRAHAGELRWEFATRNFRAVFGYIFLHGRAVGNTVLFCLLAILGALIVNPLCAYALSRYNLPYGYQILVFLLATMAFPAEVAMIPNFLLLKQLGMLNSFWALLLPGLASGYSIFLLKGFFDSLPKELYEAGILDGASELSMFARITLPLSLPIFSVIALHAFTASYGAFLFALVVCQDERMWTLMVWLYNLQGTAPQYVIMAALTLSALPMLLVFLAAQKVILRGIVLPSFK